MKLIDADKLKKEFVKACGAVPYVEGRKGEPIYIDKLIDEQPIALDEDKLNMILARYFSVPEDTYTYNLTRVKTAFDVGTMTLEDFEEFNEESIGDIADYIVKEVVKTDN